MRCKSSIVILSISYLFLALGVNGSAKKSSLLDPNSILKTIESVDGEVIDCVDIYKQPAFSHPRLANHTLQMRPSSYPIGLKPKSIFASGGNSSEEVKFQKWHKNGEYCPEGSIPIVTSLAGDFPEKKTHPFSFSTNTVTPAGSKAEYAAAFFPGSGFHGAMGDINIWNPNTKEKEQSAAQLWVTDGEGENIDTIEAGWTVSTYTNHPTLFVYWTADDYKTTGCYNMGCPGFVQTNHKIALGAFLDPASTYGGQQLFVSILIYRDDQNGNWWFNIQGQDVGYWPPDIFNGGLKGTASLLEWGGEIVNSNPGGIHTATGMGSGHFPSEGYGKAAWFKNLKYISDGGREVRDAKGITPYATKPNCYDIEVKDWDTDMEVHFYFGGPGYSSTCQN
ncbi:unnamed protein product [Linum trigynum]